MPVVALEAAAAAVVLLLVVLLARLLFRPRDTELDRFATARTVTSGWANDPGSAPAPIRELASRASTGEDIVTDDNE